MTDMLWGIDEFLLFLAALAAFALAMEAGFRLGRRHRDRSDGYTTTHVSALQAALLGLLALLLGFTFAMAVSRFDTRKSLVVDEANAIGTTYLRAQLLPPPQRQELVTLLKAYVAARLAFFDAGVDKARLDAAYAAASRIEGQLWASAIVLAEQDRRSVTAGLFIQSLNDVIDLNEKRRVALENHVPDIVIYLLFAVSMVAVGFIAYGGGLAGQRRHGSTAIFALLIALVLATILDIDRPRRGLVQVVQDSMTRLKADLEKASP